MSTATETATETAGDQWHVVEQGETLLSIAEQNGQQWETIWKHAENRDLRARRVHPHVLNPGDRVFVPQPSLKSEPLGAGPALLFVKSTNRAALRVRLEDAEGKPLARRPCRLRAGAAELVGTTDARGFVEYKVPADAELGFLQLDNASGERLELLQPGVLAPQVGEEYNTIRAYFRTPLDPDFTACLRLDAMRLIIACRELLEDSVPNRMGTDPATPPEPPALPEYLSAHASRLRSAAAAELGAESEVAQSSAAGQQPAPDEVSSRLSVMSSHAQRRADKARDAANGNSVHPRNEQDTQIFEQQVQQSLKDLVKGHQTAFAQSSGRLGRAGGGEGVDRLARCAAKEAAQREDQTPEEAAQTARAYLLDMLDRNVERIGRRLRRELRNTQQNLDELTLPGAFDSAAHQQRAPLLAQHYGQLLSEALEVLGRNAKRLGRRHELPTDCVVDVLFAEGRRLLGRTEQYARTLVPESVEQAPTLTQPATTQTGEDEPTKPATIDQEVDGAYDDLEARCTGRTAADDSKAEQPEDAELQAREQALRDGSDKVTELRKAVAKRARSSPERQRAASLDSAPQDPRQDTNAADQSDQTEHDQPAEPDDNGRVDDGDRPFEHLPIRIGHLDPINTMSGVIGRLNNLGFDAGPPSAFMGEYTRQAVREFQYVEGLPVSGEIDAATLGRLLERHGC